MTSSQQNIISSLAHLAALRMQTLKLANDSKAIAQQIEQIEKEITSVFVSTDGTSSAVNKKKRPADQMMSAAVSNNEANVADVAVAAVAAAEGAAAASLLQADAAPKKPKIPKVYPGYPKNCEFCNSYQLKTPRSKSGHERKCPGKPKVVKEPAMQMSDLFATTGVSPKPAKMDHSRQAFGLAPPVEGASNRQQVQAMPSKTIVHHAKESESDVARQQVSVKVKMSERAVDLCDDERDEEEDYDDNDEAGSLEDFVAGDDEVEYYDDGAEEEADEEAPESDQEQTTRENPKKKPRLLVRRSKIIDDESSDAEI